MPPTPDGEWFAAATSESRRRPDKKRKKRVSTKARSGAHKNAEPPEVPKYLETPEEGYWDETGAWFAWDSGQPAEKAVEEEVMPESAPGDASVPGTFLAQPRDSHSLPAARAQSRALAPLTRRVCGSAAARSHPLCLPSSGLSDEESLWDQIVNEVPELSWKRSRSSPLPRVEVYQDDDFQSRDHSQVQQGSSGRNSSTQQLRRSSTPQQSRQTSRSYSVRTSATRTVLSELALQPRPASTPPSARVPARRRNQTYSSRVRRTYNHATLQRPELSQDVYNSYAIQSPAPTQRGSPLSRQHSTRPRVQPLWSRVPLEDEDEVHVDRLLTPEPEVIRQRLRACTSQDDVDDDYGTDREESEPDAYRGRQNNASGRDEAIGEGYDPFVDYFDNEGEPDLLGEDRLFAPDSLESRNQDADDGPQYRPLTTLRQAYSFTVPRTSRRRHLTQRRYYPDDLPVILEEEEHPKLKFTQTRREIKYGDAKNHKKIKNRPPRKRRTQLGGPRKAIVDLPRPIDRITVQELRERYRFHAANPFPINSQLVQAGHRVQVETRRPPKRRALGNGGGRGVRLPGDPRIVHRSDVPDERIEPNSPSIVHLPATPAERFHYSTPGRLVLQSRRVQQRGQAVGRQNHGGVSYPALQFTTADPLTRSTTHYTKSSQQVVTHERRISDSQAVNSSRVLDSARLSPTTAGGRRQQHLTQNSSQRLSSTQSHHSQLPQQTQYASPPLGFWDAEAGQDAIEDFEPEDRMAEEYTPDPEDVPQSADTIEVVMDNGEVVRISRQEVDSFALTEALIELAQPMSPGPEDIEQFMDSVSASVPSQSARRPLGKIEVAGPDDRFSGLNLTAHLLQLAERGPQAPQQQTSRERQMEERRQRLNAKRREGGSSSSHQQSTTSRPIQTRAPQRHPANHFSQPQPTQHDAPMNVPPYPTSTDAYQQPGPVRARRSQPATSRPKLSSGPMRRSKSIGAATVSAPFKRPTRINATPPPEPTLAERLQEVIAQAVPAYEVLRLRRPRSPPPPQLGARVGANSRGNSIANSTTQLSRSRSMR